MKHNNRTLNKLNQFEYSLVIKYTEPQRLEEYKNEVCYTVGMTLCYLFNWGEGAITKRLGMSFWLYVANKYK